MNTEINRYHFTETKGGSVTDVMLDLTDYADSVWREDVLPFFEIDVMRGTRTIENGRVCYHFKLTNEMAHVLKTAVMNAMIVVQGQQN